jgi:predicted ATPase
VNRHGDGVFFVELAPITDPELVLPAVAAVLGLQADPANPLVEVLTKYLGTRDILLILDNFEHVPDAAPGVAELLARSTELRILATSRAALRIRGERELPVPPLSTADPQRSGAAAELFLARATDVRPEFLAADASTVEAVGEICRRLDGLPLAIELAAARVRLFDPPDILRRLDQRLALLTDGPVDAPKRHRSLQAALEWSVNLLDGSQRRLLATCSTFVGGWTDEAVAAIADPATSSLDELSSLVVNNLVARAQSTTGTRFTMLESIRDYAATLLDAESAEAAQRRHAEFHADLAERLHPQLFAAEGRSIREALATEMPNMEAALRWAIDAPAVGLALRLTWALRWAWELSVGRHAVGLTLSERAIALTDERSLARARAIHATANQAWAASDTTRARELWELALAVYREVGDEEGVAHLLNNLAEFEPDHDAQMAMFGESLAIMRRFGNVNAITNTLHNIGIVELMRDELGEAQGRILEGVDLAKQVGDDVHIARGTLTLAEICLYRSDLDAASDFIRQAETAASSGEVEWLAVTAAAISAQILGAAGSDDRAVEVLAKAFATEVGDYRLATIAYVAEALAPLLARASRTTEAARVLGMADAWMVPMGWRVNAPLRAKTTARLMEPAVRALGEDAFDRARAAGSQLTAEEQEAEIGHILDELASASGPNSGSGDGLAAISDRA